MFLDVNREQQVCLLFYESLDKVIVYLEIIHIDAVLIYKSMASTFQWFVIVYECLSFVTFESFIRTSNISQQTRTLKLSCDTYLLLKVNNKKTYSCSRTHSVSQNVPPPPRVKNPHLTNVSAT